MGSTRRAVALIAGGTAFGQLIALACSPIISRLVSPEQFGPFAVINAALMPLSSVAALRLEASIPLAKDETETSQVARASLRLVALFAVLGTAVAWFLRHQLVRWFSLDIDPTLLVWAPVVASLMGVFIVLNQWAIRQKLYGAIGRRNLLQAGVTAMAQVAAAAAGWGAHGLAFGLALGQLAGALSLALALRRIAVADTPRVSVLETLRSHKRFPLYLAPSALVNSLGLQAPVIVLASLYGTVVSGWLGMTQRILALPVALIGVAISQVYLGEFSATRREGRSDLQGLFLRTSRKLAVLGVGAAAVVVVAAPALFTVALGGAWRTSGVYAQCLAVGLALQMIASPLSQTLIVLERLGWQLCWDVLRLVLCCGVVWVGHAQGRSATWTVAALGAAMALSYAVLWTMSWLAVAARGARSGALNGAEGIGV